MVEASRQERKTFAPDPALIKYLEAELKSSVNT